MRHLRRRPGNKAPVPFSSPASRLNAMYSSGLDVNDEIDLYGNVGSIYGIVSRIANSTSRHEWSLGRRRSRNPDKGGIIPVERHAALDLWDQPNPFMARQELVEITQQFLELTGEGIWVVAYAEGIKLPLELWPVRPDRMAPVPSPTEYMAGWVYFGPNGQRIPLGLDEVIQLKYPNPGDPLRGLGPVSAIQMEAQSRYMATLWNLQFFRNSALPGGYVSFDRELTDTEFRTWVERWRETHQGANNAHRVGILENAKFVDASVSQRDMQFAEMMRVTGDHMREPFGIHKASVGMSEDVNRANAEAAQWLFADEIIDPRLDRIKGKLNNQLLKLYPGVDPMLQFDYEDPRPVTEAEKQASLKARSDVAFVYIDHGADWDKTLEEFELPAVPRDEAKAQPAPAPPPVPEPVDPEPEQATAA